MSSTVPATRSERPSRAPWPPLLLVATIATGWALGRVQPIAWPGLDDLPARFIGYGLGAAGLALASWGIATMIRARTTVRPDRGATVLLTTGPFRRWRNPIYLADVLIVFGVAEVTHNVWFAILAPVFALLLTWLAILPEERHLERKFGDGYRAYKARSRRWI